MSYAFGEFRMNLPSIRQLQYLVAVVELRHFGNAARQCHVSQSTLSAGIYELESILGITLIERTKRKVLPTELGLQLADKARQVLSLTAEIVDQAQAEKMPLSGPLRLGVIPTIGPFLLPKVLPGIRDKYPLLELYLLEDQTANLLERLHRGDLDCAIIALPYDIGTLQSREFWHEDFLVAFPSGHTLCSTKPVRSTELPGKELLLLEEGHCLRDHALAACHLSGLQNKVGFKGTSLYTLVQMVAGGQGITFLPEMARGTELIQQSDICFRSLAERGPHRRICLVWRQSWHRKQDLIMLGDTMHASLSAKA